MTLFAKHRRITFTLYPVRSLSQVSKKGVKCFNSVGLFYPRIFSFNQILDKLESSQAIVSSLIGIDCTGQARNHMRGMMWNGATRDEVTMVRDVVVRIAERLGVQFKAGPIAVPEIPIFQ